jgi:hypothetical protein
LSKTLFPLLLALFAAACGGSQSPPPPVATPTPAGPTSDLRPLSSREGATPATTPGPGAGMDEGTAASLPPGHPPIDGSAMGAQRTPATRSAGSIAGRISVAPSLQSSLAASDVLYVMAKKGPATLAVRRIDKPSFPLEFEISEGDAMMSGVAFEGPVDVVARVSRSGDAIPSKGDLEGTVRNVKIPARDVLVTIDRARD